MTVAGDAKAAQHGLTLAHGLHDAGRVLTVSLVILLIALAVLLPLAGVASLLWLAARALRRAARERALGPG